jgi:hypothetical protein
MASTDSLPSYLIGAREGKKAQEEFIRQETGHPSFQSMIGKFDDTFNIQVSCEEKSGGMVFLNVSCEEKSGGMEFEVV